MTPKQEHSAPERRQLAEWVSLAISTGIVLLVVALVSYRFVDGGTQPPAFSVDPDLAAVRQEGNLFYLPLEVTNTGDETAEDVLVKITLRPGVNDAETETAEFTIRFLPGGDSARSAAVFRHDPRQGDLTSHVVSYLIP